MAEGWLPPALNGGWIYRDRIDASSGGVPVTVFYASRYHHSPPAVWLRRLEAGEIERNGRPLRQDAVLAAGDRLAWHRPPWREGAVPALPQPLHDDGDLLVLAKPSGLPVLPAGGWLEHTVLRLLERRHAGDPAGLPRPVHRLGRFTSGLLVCARRPASRAWLSALLRESTGSRGGDGSAGAGSCRKLYRALAAPLPSHLRLAPGEAVRIRTPIGRRAHPLLGRLWCAAAPDDPYALPALSTLTLLESRPEGALVEVAIASGRPHQIRIHTAAFGAPLLGDPLYLPGGLARDEALPGEGGYRLHAHRLSLPLPHGRELLLEAPLPPPLRGPGDG
ncbi:RluA family pseudouridine synthase [Cyanobium sp. FGCU-52]|nr:RluA family pseudouridine synthase [Cyanobium sp. FGCU52]